MSGQSGSLSPRQRLLPTPRVDQAPGENKNKRPRRSSDSLDIYEHAVSIAEQQISSSYYLCKTLDVDIDAIMGRLLEERRLPAITERDARIRQLEQTFNSENDDLKAQLEATMEELKACRAANDLLEAEKKADSLIGTFQGVGAAIVAMSRIGKTRSAHLTAWRLFQPYALKYTCRNTLSPGSLSLDTMFLPRPSNILDRLEAARQDLEADTGPPPGLLGGDDTDVRNATELIMMETGDLDAMVFVADKPYTNGLLALLLRRIQLRHRRYSPAVETLFGMKSRHFVNHGHRFPSFSTESTDTPPLEKSTVIGVINFGAWPNVYSWHPLHNLLVVYTWRALGNINSASPLDPEQIFSSLQSIIQPSIGGSAPRTEIREIYHSDVEGYIGPLTVKLVRTLLNGAVTIDLGLASSSSALFPDTAPTESDIEQIRLEDFGDLVSDLDQSRSFWETLGKGELL